MKQVVLGSHICNNCAAASFCVCEMTGLVWFGWVVGSEVIPLFEMPSCSHGTSPTFLDMTHTRPPCHLALSLSQPLGERRSLWGMDFVDNLVRPFGTLELGFGEISRPFWEKALKLS